MKKGFALLTVIFILLVFSVLAIGIVSLVFSGSRRTVDDYRYDKAFYLAEAGRAYGIQYLYGINDWTLNLGLPITTTFNGGNFTFSAVNPTAGQVELHSVGQLVEEGKTYQREVSSILVRAMWGFTSQYAIYWAGGASAGGTTQVNNNVAIHGDTLVNNNLNFGTGTTAQNVYATGSITGTLSGISGTYEANTALPVDPPVFSTTYYDNQISTAQNNPTLVGDQTWGNKTITGNIYIKGNLTISNNATINVTGSALVAVTGTVTIKGGVEFGNNLTLISAGLITTNNNVEVGNHCIFYSTAGFSIGNDLESGSFLSGAGTSFITPGNLNSFGNNAEFFGFIYCGGSMSLGNNTQLWGNVVANNLNSIGNGSQLHVNGGLVNYNNIPGISGAIQTKTGTWEEVF